MSMVKPIRDLFLQGPSPSNIALCVACGLILAVFPMIGTTTLLCTAAAVTFGLNLPAIQAVNYLAAPLQLILLLPLMRLGNRLFGTGGLSLTAEQVFSMVRQHPWSAITTLGVSTFHAMIAWLLLAPVAFVLLYFPAHYAFQRFAPVIDRGGKSQVWESVDR